MSIDAMKQALEALEECIGYKTSPFMTRECEAAILALRAAIEQAQKPVAFDHGIGSDRFKVVRGAFWWHVLIGDSPTEHGKFRSRAGAEKMAADLLREFRNGAFVQHTAPSQWQGLTQREIDELWDLHHDDYGNALSATGYERAIEAKLRERNA